MEPVTYAYDRVAYPGQPYYQTHPDRLATLAHLHGMSPAPIEHCRVLELGCGDGANLIPMALQLQTSEFLGIDLASSAVRKGLVLISELGLANIRLEHRDLMDFRPAPVQFDYIIAHGLFSWVPEEVQDRIFEIVQECLAPQGVAYISYNTLPGGHLRLMMREMMKYHTRRFTNPEQQLDQALALIRSLAEAQDQSAEFGKLLQQEWCRLSSRIPAAVYHDEFGEYNKNLYFHEFMSRAATHGLQFLSEASFPEMQARSLSTRAEAMLGECGDDVVSREQYLDFFKGRRFRQTLLCRDSVRLERNVPFERVTEFLVSCSARPSSPVWEPDLQSPVEFRGPLSSSITTAHPLIKAALVFLEDIWPAPVPFAEIWDSSHLKLHSLGSSELFDAPEDKAGMARTFFLLYCAGLLDFHSWDPRVVINPGRCPMSSPLARLQARNGEPVTTAVHLSVELSGTLERELLQLLDGTRERAAVLEGLTRAVLSGRATLPADSAHVRDAAKVREFLDAGLERELGRLGKLGLLLA